MFNRYWNDPFFSQPSPMIFRPSFPMFDFNDNEMKELQSELDKTNHGDDASGHSYSRSTFTTRTQDGIRTHDVKTYRAADGREITKEIRKLGDQAHQITKIKGSNSAEPAISANIEGKALEDFNTKWNSYESSKPSIEDSSKCDKELENLRNQMSAIQDRIKQLEDR